MANRKSTKTFPTVTAGRWWLFISRVLLVVPIVVVMAAISFSLFLFFSLLMFYLFILTCSRMIHTEDSALTQQRTNND
jgi:hypothetical protein